MYRSDVMMISRQAGDLLTVAHEPVYGAHPVVVRINAVAESGGLSLMLDRELADDLCGQLETLLRPGRLDREADARLGRDSTGASAADLEEVTEPRPAWVGEVVAAGDDPELYREPASFYVEA